MSQEQASNISKSTARQYITSKEQYNQDTNLSLEYKDVRYSIDPQHSILNSISMEYQLQPAKYSRSRLSLWLNRFSKQHTKSIFQDLGQCYLCLKIYQKSIVCYRKAIELNASSFQTYLRLGQIYKQMGRSQEANANFKKAFEINSQKIQGYPTLGKFLWEINQNKLAVKCFQKAIEYEPHCSQNYGNLAIALFKSNLHEAKKLLEKVIQIDQNNPKIISLYGGILLNEGKTVEAIHFLERAVTLNPNNAIAFCNLGSALTIVGSCKAESCFQRAIELNNNLSQAHASLARIYFKREDYKKSGEYAKKAIEINDNNQEAYIIFGSIFIHLKQYHQAIQCLNKAKDLNQDDHEVYRLLGIALTNLHSYQQAIEHFQKAIQLNKNDIISINRLEELMQKTKKRFSKVAYNIQKINIGHFASQALDIAELGKAYQIRKNWRQATKLYRKAIELNPKVALPYLQIGLRYYSKFNYSLAISYLIKCIECDTNCCQAYNILAVCLAMQNRTKEAKIWCQKAIKTKSADENTYRILGQLYISLGMTNEVEGCYEEAIKINQDDVSLHNQLGFLLYQRKKTQQSLNHCQKAIQCLTQPQSQYLSSHFSLSIFLLLYNQRYHDILDLFLACKHQSYAIDSALIVCKFLNNVQMKQAKRKFYLYSVERYYDNNHCLNLMFNLSLALNGGQYQHFSDELINNLARETDKADFPQAPGILEVIGNCIKMYERYHKRQRVNRDHTINIRLAILYNLMGCKDLFIRSVDKSLKEFEANKLKYRFLDINQIVEIEFKKDDKIVKDTIITCLALRFLYRLRDNNPNTYSKSQLQYFYLHQFLRFDHLQLLNYACEDLIASVFERSKHYFHKHIQKANKQFLRKSQEKQKVRYQLCFVKDVFTSRRNLSKNLKPNIMFESHNVTKKVKTMQFKRKVKRDSQIKDAKSNRVPKTSKEVLGQLPQYSIRQLFYQCFSRSKSSVVEERELSSIFSLLEKHLLQRCQHFRLRESVCDKLYEQQYLLILNMVQQMTVQGFLSKQEVILTLQKYLTHFCLSDLGRANHYQTIKYLLQTDNLAQFTDKLSIQEFTANAYSLNQACDQEQSNGYLLVSMEQYYSINSSQIPESSDPIIRRRSLQQLQNNRSMKRKNQSILQNIPFLKWKIVRDSLKHPSQDHIEMKSVTKRIENSKQRLQKISQESFISNFNDQNNESQSINQPFLANAQESAMSSVNKESNQPYKQVKQQENSISIFSIQHNGDSEVFPSKEENIYDKIKRQQEQVSNEYQFQANPKLAPDNIAKVHWSTYLSVERQPSKNSQFRQLLFKNHAYMIRYLWHRRDSFQYIARHYFDERRVKRQGKDYVTFEMKIEKGLSCFIPTTCMEPCDYVRLLLKKGRENLLRWIYCFVQGILQLQDCGVFHADLCLRNTIQIDAQGRSTFKIIDFDYAFKVSKPPGEQYTSLFNHTKHIIVFWMRLQPFSQEIMRDLFRNLEVGDEQRPRVIRKIYQSNVGEQEKVHQIMRQLQHFMYVYHLYQFYETIRSISWALANSGHESQRKMIESIKKAAESVATIADTTEQSSKKAYHQVIQVISTAK